MQKNDIPEQQEPISYDPYARLRRLKAAGYKATAPIDGELMVSASRSLAQVEKTLLDDAALLQLVNDGVGDLVHEVDV